MGKKNKYFDEVDTKVNFPEMEKKLLDHWYESGVVKKYLNKNKTSKKRFSFLDGPITANGPMGVHHGWGRTYKDLWQRYKNMQGYKQRFQNGFDSQGLWVEVEVEKNLGFKNKKEIEDYGVAKFVQKCRDLVIKFSDIQTEQSKRLGYFMDWENSYFTMSDENNYMIWYFLSVCHKNGWLYKGRESVPWCPRCETAISQHEILTENYKEVEHDSVYFALPISGKKNQHLLVWTTTPWTIPANIAVAVDKKLDYSLVEHKDKTYWVAKELVNKLFDSSAKIVKSQKGEKLVGLTYSGPFDDLPAVREVSDKKGFHTIIATDDRIMPITTQEGTGLVHTAVSAGTEDFKLGKKLGLPMIPVIADNADYLEGLGSFSGQNAKNHPELILDYLKGNGWVFKIGKYKHRYPRCWRCKTELVWKVTDEWYIAMDKAPKNSKDKRTLRERMIEVTKQITWIPGFGLKRELDWLNNMNDWLISKKNRYWGLCLPIWECTECKHFEVVGSKEDLKKRATSGWKQFEGKSPHKPYVGNIKLKCSKCEGEAKRVEPVGNPWLDAGIISFSTITQKNEGNPLYLTNKAEWKKWFPADFITESFPGQFKNWFYSMIAMATVLENTAPYKTVMGYATLLGEDGRPMHKSWGNAIDFNEGADKIGVDVMRWMYINQNYADNMLFGYKIADETRRRFHLRLWNTYNFFVTYANLDEWKPKKSKSISTNVLDIWILARLDQTIATVTAQLDSYTAYSAAASIDLFVEDLSTWFVRRSRGRVGFSAQDKKDKDHFYNTMLILMVDLSRMLAPFTPFMADAIYTNLTKEESVHLTTWPNTNKLTKAQSELVSDMKLVREVAEKAHAQRKIKEIPVRQPLLSIKVSSPHKKPSDNLLYILCDEINVKSVKWEKGSKLRVALDTKITPEFEVEARVRDLIRRIQKERRKLGVDLTDRIEVVSDWLPSDKATLKMLKTKTLTTKLSKGKSLKVKKTS